MLKFFLGDPKGIALSVTLALAGLYGLAPVFLHSVLWETIILHLPTWIPLILAIVATLGAFARYGDRKRGERINVVTVSLVIVLLIVGTGFALLAGSWKNVQLYRMNRFEERPQILGVSNEQMRFKPVEIAQQDMVRKNKSSEFTPGPLSAIGSEKGVAYIAPLVPQGVINTFLMENRGFMYLDDSGTDEERNRVSKIDTEPFAWGEGMEVFDDIYRRLIYKVGFTNSYPEIYYTPISKDGVIVEVVGVVPYISYAFRGVFVPVWGGVAIFHADGAIEDLSPAQAKRDPRLMISSRAFPETLARQIVQAQRFDTGMIGGWIRRPGKIQVPDLPGRNEMPYFLSMDDGSFQYVTSVEPDGEGFSVMRIYYVNALTGERSVYRFDTPENAERNLLGPAKSLDLVKAIEGYNWYESDSSGGSGSYRIVEPRPATPRGNNHLHWMWTITDVKFSREVATAFVDTETNAVYGPFKTRKETRAFLYGERTSPAADDEPEALDLTPRTAGTSNLCVDLSRLLELYCADATAP